jgi:hypothetical protein
MKFLQLCSFLKEDKKERKKKAKRKLPTWHELNTEFLAIA